MQYLKLFLVIGCPLILFITLMIPIWKREIEQEKELKRYRGEKTPLPGKGESNSSFSNSTNIGAGGFGAGIF